MIVNQNNKVCLLLFQVGWRQTLGCQNSYLLNNNEVKQTIAKIVEGSMSSAKVLEQT